MTLEPTTAVTGVTAATGLGFALAALSQLSFAWKEWRNWKREAKEWQTSDRLFNAQEGRLADIIKELDDCRKDRKNLFDLVMLLANNIHDLPPEVMEQIVALSPKIDPKG